MISIVITRMSSSCVHEAIDSLLAFVCRSQLHDTTQRLISFIKHFDTIEPFLGHIAIIDRPHPLLYFNYYVDGDIIEEASDAGALSTGLVLGEEDDDRDHG